METRLRVLKPMHLVDPEVRLSLILYLPDDHIVVENTDDARRLINGGYCADPGPAAGE